ncbi:hypothetical protein PSAB6_230335 [Paraburkholderia sabiae]|nr:hypothetical protein PSAB6_230335 [Paraburkholderia sabiae]
MQERVQCDSRPVRAGRRVSTSDGLKRDAERLIDGWAERFVVAAGERGLGGAILIEVTDIEPVDVILVFLVMTDHGENRSRVENEHGARADGQRDANEKIACLRSDREIHVAQRDPEQQKGNLRHTSVAGEHLIDALANRVFHVGHSLGRAGAAGGGQ